MNHSPLRETLMLVRGYLKGVRLPDNDGGFLMTRIEAVLAASEPEQHPTDLGEDGYDRMPLSQPTDFTHTRSCPMLNPMNDESCTCGLEWRIRLQTETEMHNAWRKRAEEAERDLERAHELAASQGGPEESRSVQRRKALQQGEPVPTFAPRITVSHGAPAGAAPPSWANSECAEVQADQAKRNNEPDPRSRVCVCEHNAGVHRESKASSSSPSCEFCGCRAFRAKDLGLVRAAIMQVATEAYAQGRLDEFLHIKFERPIDPIYYIYWDTHHERELREAAGRKAEQSHGEMK